MENEKFQELVLEKLSNNEKFQEILVAKLGEIKDELHFIGSRLDRMREAASEHSDKIELVSIQIRGLQREPNKEDIGGYIARKKFTLVESTD